MRLLRLGLLPWRGLYVTPLLLVVAFMGLFSLRGEAIPDSLLLSLAATYSAGLCYYAVRCAWSTRIPMTAMLLPPTALILHLGYAFGTVRGLFTQSMPMKGESRPANGRIAWVPHQSTGHQQATQPATIIS